MAKSNQKFNPWMVLAIGIVLGAIGYYFYTTTFASGFSVTAKGCQAGGGRQSGRLCVGGDFDGARIR